MRKVIKGDMKKSKTGRRKENAKREKEKSDYIKKTVRKSE